MKTKPNRASHHFFVFEITEIPTSYLSRHEKYHLTKSCIHSRSKAAKQRSTAGKQRSIAATSISSNSINQQQT
ncbi:unnamed protein product [Lactuca virosa]|uniref:Uncharacterized protein n=1 Tax=Lactuca virosa TaxID=75947 RepID=A0AAU9P1K7_9ASTR|nr:unnamed protein product [Lactuca virosa]